VAGAKQGQKDRGPGFACLQYKARAAKKPSDEEALLVTFGASKVTAQRQLSGKNIV